MTNAEKTAAQILCELGFNIKKHSDRLDIDPANTIYTQYQNVLLPKIRIDFALVCAQIAIEVQGDYWHATDLSQKKLTTAQVVSRLRDNYKTKLLSEKGWKLIRIHECDVFNKEKAKQHLHLSILNLLLV